MGISTNTRNRESFMLAINNVFGPPISVRNDLFARANELCKQEKIPYDVESWIRARMGSIGYTEEKELVLDKRTYRILSFENSKAQ